MEKIYNSEEEFLKDYDSSKFEKLSMTADILIISVSNEEVDNYRKTDKKKMSILLVKRDNYPFKDKWCLPGGFIDINEDLDEAPKRILKNEIEKIAPHEAISTMLTQTLRTNDMYEMEKMLVLIDKLLASVPFYRLRCNMEKEAADVSFNGMQN